MKKKSRKPAGIPGRSKNKSNDCGMSSVPETPSVRLSPANNSLVYIACLVLLIVISYANALDVPFQWDEDLHIANEPIIRDLHYFVSPSEARGFENYNFFISRYIPHLTFALDYKIHGLSLPGYHVVNIAIHIANSILVYLLVLSIFKTPAMGTQLSAAAYTGLIAFFPAAIFAVHPLQTAAVTYIMQRYASLMAFFYLLSVVAYIKFRLISESKRPASGGAKSRDFNVARGREQSAKALKESAENAVPYAPCTVRYATYAVSLASAILAMKSKENAITLPLVIMLCEFCFFSRTAWDSPGKGRSKEPVAARFHYLIPFLLTMAIIPLTIMNMTNAAGKADKSLIDPGSYMAGFTWNYSPQEYFFTQFRVIISYLRMFFFPANLNLDYEYPVFKSFFNLPVLASFLFLLSVFGAGVFLLLRSRRSGVHSTPRTAPAGLIGFGILWFFITLSVESVITTPRLIEPYRVYLPSAGIMICFAATGFLLKEHFRSPKAGKTMMLGLVLVLGILSVATHQQNERYKDKIRMWEDTAKRFPAYAKVHLMLGRVYQDSNMPDKAIEQNMIAIKLDPALSEAHNNLGVIYVNAGRFNEAVEQYLSAINLQAGFALAHYNLGALYYKMGQRERAREELTTFLKMKPGDQQALELLNSMAR